MLTLLLEDRPGDISFAVDAAYEMPPKFLKQLREGLEQVDSDTVRQQVEELLSSPE